MKDSHKWWIGILCLILIAILGPLIIGMIMLALSPIVPPLIFIGILICIAAIIAYKGGIGR